VSHGHRCSIRFGEVVFLGRLVEELMLETKARCVILDPNADFRRIGETVSSKYWETASYNQRRNQGFLPHESSVQVFSTKWEKVQKNLRGGPGLPQ